MTFFATWLARIALSFGKGEFFAIVVFGLVLLTSLSGKDRLKGVIVVCMGTLIGCIGIDELFGTLRFTFGMVPLYKGISFVTFIMGVYGIAELLSAVCSKEDSGVVEDFKLKNQYLTGKEIKSIVPSIVRGCLIGFGIGLVPGAGATIATFCAYGAEKSLSKHPEEFGTGILQGVAAPEASNNAAIFGGMVPLLSLGLPFTSSMAMLMSAFVMHGVTVGPLFISEHPEIFWGLIASMFIGNIMLLIINLPLVGVWASLLRVDFSILMPIITFITFTGGYAINSSMFDIGVMLVCGILGFFMGATGYNMAALAVAVFLSGTLEDALCGTMTVFHGSLFEMMGSRPIAAVIMACALLVILITSGRSIRKLVLARKQK
jgi:putative tricarboxylic transport membrane protein